MFKTKIKENWSRIRVHIIYLLVISIIVIWTISSVIALRFYNDYVSLLIKASEAKELSYDNQKPLKAEQLSTEEQVMKMVRVAGLNEKEIYALILCESHWDRYAIGDSGKSRGLWQINKIYHDISNECAFDPICSTKWSIEKILHDGNLSAWSCSRILGI